jgi:hypothetical protein
MSYPELSPEHTPFEVPEPSTFDVENLSEILRGMGDWFDAELFRLIRHADGQNTELLRMVYPLHVQAYERYMRGEKA